MERGWREVGRFKNACLQLRACDFKYGSSIDVCIWDEPLRARFHGNCIPLTLVFELVP